jgi:hypothetical protein
MNPHERRTLRRLDTLASEISANITNGNRSDARRMLLALPPAHVAHVVCDLLGNFGHKGEEIRRLVSPEI